MFDNCDIIISYASFKIKIFYFYTYLYIILYIIYIQEILVNNYFYNLEIKENLI